MQSKGQLITGKGGLLFHLFLSTVLLCIFLPSPLPATGSEALSPVKIGILAKRGDTQAMRQWQLTADYLAAAIPHHSFKIIPLDFNQVPQEVKDKSIDFILTNSGNYVELEYQYGISRIATMKNLLDHQPHNLFAGVIFTRANRTDINELSDLIDKSFYAVDPSSLGGWLMALREMRAQGLDPEKDCKKVHFTGTHDNVVIAVLKGEADAGTVRTDTLERMAEEKKIDISLLKILNPQPAKDNFRNRHSTRLYPEWPLAKLKHVPDKLAEDVAIALLQMPGDSNAAKAAHISGWTVPLDYQPIHELYQDLRLGPYAQHRGPISATDIIRQHWLGAIILLTMFCLLTLITIFSLRLNRKLSLAQAEIANQLNIAHSAQQSQRDSELKYRAIFHGTNNAIFVHDLETGKILDVNNAMRKIYGYSEEETKTISLQDLSSNITPYTMHEAQTWIAKARDEGPQKFEWQAKRKNGELFWVEVHLKKTVIGNHERLLAVVHDINENKKQKEELDRYRDHLEKLVHERTAGLITSEAQLARAQRIAKLGSWEWEPQNNTMWWAKEVYQLCGFNQDDFGVTYDFFLNLVHPADRNMVQQAFNDAIAKRRRVNIDHRFLLPDGSEKMVNEQAEIYYTENGAPLKLAGTIQDITERKLLEQEHFRLIKAVEQTGDSIVITDKKGTILYVNPAFEKTTGYSKEEAIGQNPRILQGGQHDQSFYKALWTTLDNGRVWSGHFNNKKKDGTIFKEEATISPIFDTAGNIINYVAVKRDVTERDSLEKQLRQAQKLEGIGTLAGGIAHDFNNILTAILGFGELVMEELPKGSNIRQSQAEVIKAAKRAAELVKQILTFSRQGEQELKPLSIQLITKEALKLLRASIPTTIAFRQEIDANCGPVLADPTQIHQIIMNLCTNAYHAMRETGGELRVSLASIELDQADLHDKPALSPGPYALLKISDTGHGMDKKVLDRIFEPYFTTKDQGEGTGLGLSLVHGIVKNIGGEITVTSEPGAGTTFYLYLPRIDIKTKNEDQQSPPAIIGGNEHILIVDDEEAVVIMEKKLLERLGYKVTACNDSRAALQTFMADPEQFDLVISDMTMPFMTGKELAGKILAAHPDMPIIICTGFSENLNKEEMMAMGIKALTMKPISREEFTETIRHALAAN
ncbi:MAG: PAS domain S-box protein [Desulfobulbaceae bacterium]|nr:PAS domain S-box protein [Desulfobulbaceae bacterium]HIJ79359.1 PAS domain S-box protein [Deltaproteobacteria bacterium]